MRTSATSSLSGQSSKNHDGSVVGKAASDGQNEWVTRIFRREHEKVVVKPWPRRRDSSSRLLGYQTVNQAKKSGTRNETQQDETLFDAGHLYKLQCGGGSMHGWRSSPTRSFKTSPPMLPCVITNEEHCRIGSAERGLRYLQRTKERRQGTVEHYETEHCKGSKRNRTWQPLTGLPPTTRHWEAERSSSETCCHCLLQVMA